MNIDNIQSIWVFFSNWCYGKEPNKGRNKTRRKSYYTLSFILFLYSIETIHIKELLGLSFFYFLFFVVAVSRL